MELGYRVPIVVAADDDALRRLLVRVLGDAGHIVEPVADGHELLHRMRASIWPCVALLSLSRSRLNSHAVLAAVAAEEALARGHGYILLTALWDALPGDYATVIRDLSVVVVPKPFDLDGLVEAVARAANRVIAA